MAYYVVQGIDLRDYGFGKSNTFHSGDLDLNVAFDRMYKHHDYHNPSFAITTPTLLTDAGGDCPPDCQIIEFLTVANYEYFNQLKQHAPKAYRHKKAEILESILDVIERDYIPNFRSYLVFKITGSPTTNEHFCYCPEGNSYGSSLTPQNMGLDRLNHETSLKNFYFCNASSFLKNGNHYLSKVAITSGRLRQRSKFYWYRSVTRIFTHKFILSPLCKLINSRKILESDRFP